MASALALLQRRHGDHDSMSGMSGMSGMAGMPDMMGMGGDSKPLSAVGVDFSNSTQASDFLDAMLDDTIFAGVGNTYALYFWYGIAAVVGLAALANAAQILIQHFRLRAAKRNRAMPSTPQNPAIRALATMTAITREMIYPQFSPAWTSGWFKIPPFGTLFLLLAYLIFVLVLEFIHNDVPGGQHYTALGVRAGWLAVAQVPLLILLAGKNNIVGLLTGASYARLNVLHRWVARMLLLMATLHFGYQSYGWNEYGLTQLEWSTDDCPPTGIAVYAILVWMNLSTLAPIRNWNYEFFVVQHLITFVGFIVAIMYHIPSTALHARIYIWIPIGIYLFDRIIRTLRYLWNNSRPAKATLTPLDGQVTKIRVKSAKITRWTPGSFVLLSMSRYGLLQSHPATIASTPTSHGGDLIFLLKSRKGFTRRLLEGSSLSTTDLKVKAAPLPVQTACLDGPYGGKHPDFAAFDTVLLIAGSTGATFTLSLLLDLAHRATRLDPLPVRRVVFVWIVKRSAHSKWFADELATASAALRAAGIQITVTIHVTCSDALTDIEAATAPPSRSCCGCAAGINPCCCGDIIPEQGSDTKSASDSMYSTDREKANEVEAGIITAETDAEAEAEADANADSTSPLARTLSCATLCSGRPLVDTVLWDILDSARGETGVAVCGPLSLNQTVRNAVAATSDARAVHKGTGAQGIYLHVEEFSW